MNKNALIKHSKPLGHDGGVTDFYTNPALLSKGLGSGALPLNLL